jgi:uncharacterized protein YciI
MSEQQLFIYKIQPVRPAMLSLGATPDEERIIGEHFAYLERLASAGVVLLAGRTLTEDTSSFGIIIFRADSPVSAQCIVDADPAVQQRVMRAECFPFRIALMGKVGES